MKTIWNLCLAYGATYLREVVAACEPCVDRIIVMYTAVGSQGYRTNIPCPESEDELRACFDGVKDRLEWHKGEWGTEGAHRNAGQEIAVAQGADLVLQHDADEIWDGASLRRCIAEAEASPIRNHGINGFVHYWRSFGWASTDVWCPIRIIKPSGNPGTMNFNGTVHHMSYAEPETIVDYKRNVSGHKREFRPEWWEHRFLANVKEDIHPTCRSWWNAKPVGPATLPPELLSHSNADLELIR